MYADRFGPKKVNRGSLGASVGIVGGLLAVALMSSPYVRGTVFVDPPLPTYIVPPEEPPPPPDPRPKVRPRQAQPAQRIDQPVQQVVTPRPAQPYVAPPMPGPAVEAGALTGAGAGVVVDPPKPPPPVFKGADVDPRYAGLFQPVYPAEERRAGTEGVVTLRVLIGTDGRVRQVERVAAASEAFWRVTQERALAKWRFKPATRDGIPVESWRTMTVRFVMEKDS